MNGTGRVNIKQTSMYMSFVIFIIMGIKINYMFAKLWWSQNEELWTDGRKR